jgi:hypothetical protein
MLDELPSLVDELDIEIVIGYGSTFTGIKRGLIGRRDIDLIIVTDFFGLMSMYKRKQLVGERLGKRVDLILLTTQEYKNLRKRRQSVVNIARKEGRILYAAKKQSDDRTRQKT